MTPYPKQWLYCVLCSSYGALHRSYTDQSMARHESDIAGANNKLAKQAYMAQIQSAGKDVCTRLAALPKVALWSLPHSYRHHRGAIYLLKSLHIN